MKSLFNKALLLALIAAPVVANTDEDQGPEVALDVALVDYHRDPRGHQRTYSPKKQVASNPTAKAQVELQPDTKAKVAMLEAMYLADNFGSWDAAAEASVTPNVAANVEANAAAVESADTELLAHRAEQRKAIEQIRQQVKAANIAKQGSSWKTRIFGVDKATLKAYADNEMQYADVPQEHRAAYAAMLFPTPLTERIKNGASSMLNYVNTNRLKSAGIAAAAIATGAAVYKYGPAVYNKIKGLFASKPAPVVAPVAPKATTKKTTAPKTTARKTTARKATTRRVATRRPAVRPAARPARTVKSARTVQTRSVVTVKKAVIIKQKKNK